MTGVSPQVALGLPPLLHVGMIVLDLTDAAASFARRWGAEVTDIADVTMENALYHDKPSTVTVRRGLIRSTASDIELTQPLSDSPFLDFLKLNKGDGLHHLAYVVDDIDVYLERLRPTTSELVLDARLADGSNRVVYIDGFAHGPTIELIQRQPGTTSD